MNITQQTTVSLKWILISSLTNFNCPKKPDVARTGLFRVSNPIDVNTVDLREGRHSFSILHFISIMIAYLRLQWLFKIFSTSRSVAGAISRHVKLYPKEKCLEGESMVVVSPSSKQFTLLSFNKLRDSLVDIWNSEAVLKIVNIPAITTENFRHSIIHIVVCVSTHNIIPNPCT